MRDLKAVITENNYVNPEDEDQKENNEPSDVGELSVLIGSFPCWIERDFITFRMKNQIIEFFFIL